MAFESLWKARRNDRRQTPLVPRPPELLPAFYDYRPGSPGVTTLVNLSHRQVAAAVINGPDLRAPGVAMAFKLIESAPARLRAVDAPLSSRWSASAPRLEKGDSSVTRRIRPRIGR